MLYLTDALILKSYTATTRGAKSTIRIEIETEDTYELGYLLRELGEAQQKQRAGAQAKKAAKARRPLALPPPGA